MWSKSSRRELSIHRSAIPFCHGLSNDLRIGLRLIERTAMIAAVKATSIIPKRTLFRSPWQNGIAERWVGSCRRDLLDHVVALNERRLKRLLSEYVRYHHEDRTHPGLEKGTPDGRIRSVASGRVFSQERLGGLHHRYNRALVRPTFGRSFIYVRSTRMQASPYPESSCCTESIIVFHTC